jgi:hypothetical protein
MRYKKMICERSDEYIVFTFLAYTLWHIHFYILPDSRKNSKNIEIHVPQKKKKIYEKYFLF